MATIKPYTLKSGEKRYSVSGYIGLNPKTNKQFNFFRRGFKSKKAANIAAKKIEFEILNGTFKKDKNKKNTFKEMYEMWFKNDYSQGNRKRSTLATTKRNFRLHILPIFQDYLIDKITPSDVYDAVKQWNKEKLQKTNQLKNYLSNVLQFAVTNGYVERNAAQGIRVPKHEHKINRDTIGNYYDIDELNEFLNCLKEDNKGNYQPYVFFTLLAYTGLRKGEAFALTWNDIDFNNNKIDINKTLSKVENELVIQSPKTKGSKRNLKVAKPIINILKKWQIEQKKFLLKFGINQNPQNLIFTNKNATLWQPTKAKVWLDRTQKKHNLKHVTAHGFRHTFATLSFANGVDVKTVSKYLGHTNIETTMDVYTAVTKEQENDASEKMAKLIRL